MAESDADIKFDLVYMLEGHGWSTCVIILDHTFYKLVPTHIFDNPLETLLLGFTRTLAGDAASDIIWHDEPGRYDWHIERNPEQHHIVGISISNCVRLDAQKPGQLIDITFQIKLETISTVILHQARKLRDLMQMESYAKTRGEFPHVALQDFEQAYRVRYRR